MPRRSGNDDVWPRASRAASGAHMSPVLRSRGATRRAGPCPPTRTKICAPGEKSFGFEVGRERGDLGPGRRRQEHGAQGNQANARISELRSILNIDIS